MSTPDTNKEDGVKRFNHCSTDYGKWVEYNGTRFKDLYSIETLDGVVYPLARPNGNAWHILPVIDCTEEEYRILADDQPLPYKPVPESKYLEVERNRVDDSAVAKLALVPDSELPFDGFHFTGNSRIKHNRKQFAGLLSLEEPVLDLAPARAKAKYFSLVVLNNKKEHQFCRYAGPVIFPQAEFVKHPDCSFTLDTTVAVELIPEFIQGTNDAFWRPLFQRGWRFKATLDITTRVTEDDAFGHFTSTIKDVVVTKQGRGFDPDEIIKHLEDYPFCGVIHFTFYSE